MVLRGVRIGGWFIRSSPDVYTLACGVSDGAKDAGRLRLDEFACVNGVEVWIPYGELLYANPRYSDALETGIDCRGMCRPGCICEFISIP